MSVCVCPPLARALGIWASASFKLVPTINSKQNYNPKKVVVFLSVQKEANDDNLVVYPNPFSQSISFNLSLKENSTVDIALYSMTGVALYTQKLELPAGNHEHTITVNLPAGAYMLQVNYGNKTKSTIVLKS